MGVAAKQQLNTNIKNTAINFKHLLGRKFSDPITQKFRQFIPCEMVQLPNDGIGLKVDLLPFLPLLYCMDMNDIFEHMICISNISKAGGSLIFVLVVVP